jgi:hypothetical protein
MKRFLFIVVLAFLSAVAGWLARQATLAAHSETASTHHADKPTAQHSQEAVVGLGRIEPAELF